MKKMTVMFWEVLSLLTTPCGNAHSTNIIQNQFNQYLHRYDKIFRNAKCCRMINAITPKRIIMCCVPKMKSGNLTVLRTGIPCQFHTESWLNKIHWLFYDEIIMHVCLGNQIKIHIKKRIQQKLKRSSVRITGWTKTIKTQQKPGITILAHLNLYEISWT